MSMLFRIEANPEAVEEFNILGFEWVEVWAIEPRAIANKGKGYGPWCHKLLVNWYICMTEHGVIRMPAEDFWSAIEAYNFSTPKNAQPVYQITAESHSVIQLNSPGSRAKTRGDKVRDKYVAKQVGIQGPKARARNITNLTAASIDLNILAKELPSIRQEMKRNASAAEQDLAIGAVASAEIAAKNGDEKGTMRHLKQAGAWALDVATKLGTEVAAKAISHSLGLGS